MVKKPNIARISYDTVALFFSSISTVLTFPLRIEPLQTE